MEREWPNETGHRRRKRGRYTRHNQRKKLKAGNPDSCSDGPANSDDDVFYHPVVTMGIKYFPTYADRTSTSQQADTQKHKEEEIQLPEFKQNTPPPFPVFTAPYQQKEKKKMTRPYQIMTKPKTQSAKQQHCNQTQNVSYAFSDEDQERQTKPADLDLKLVDYDFTDDEDKET